MHSKAQDGINVVVNCWGLKNVRCKPEKDTTCCIHHFFSYCFDSAWLLYTLKVSLLFLFRHVRSLRSDSWKKTSVWTGSCSYVNTNALQDLINVLFSKSVNKFGTAKASLFANELKHLNKLESLHSWNLSWDYFLKIRQTCLYKTLAFT